MGSSAGKTDMEDIKEIGNDGPSELLKSLLDGIRPLESVAVGFSGGVDSSVVVAAAARELGAAQVLAVTADSETLPATELDEAREIAASLGVAHTIIRTREIENESFSANPVDRCYHCKTELWEKVRILADERGLKHIADGVNVDDIGDFRPGIEAGDEAGIRHPLKDAGAGKHEVRILARELGLTNWDKPAQACLSSRFPYGCRITAEGLKRVELAEEFLRSLGFKQLRVRDHEGIARIEVPSGELGKIADVATRAVITKRLKELGFSYVTLDLEGFRSGSLNEVL